MEKTVTWKNIKRGIGMVLVLMIAISGWSWTGIDEIVSDAKELSAGNKLVGILLQREIDHLNWDGDVNTLLTDEKVTNLTVQTNHTKCGFGKWLYGNGQKEAENLLPVLKNLLTAIEVPHKQLHQSAIKIGAVFKTADNKLPMILANREADHLT
jgi:methyl-accepting chemotaxis protein